MKGKKKYVLFKFPSEYRCRECNGAGYFKKDYYSPKITCGCCHGAGYVKGEVVEFPSSEVVGVIK
jgi:DnaJ-class molecular chaperone